MKEFEKLFGTLTRKVESYDKKPKDMTSQELKNQIKIKTDLLNDAKKIRNFKNVYQIQTEIDTLEYFLKGKQR